MSDHDVDFFLGLESRVWAALESGDAAAEYELLSEDFLGVYPSGFADRDEHASLLVGGPTVLSHTVSDARLIGISEDAVMLCYRAEHESPSRMREVMYVSSLWQRRDGRWWNTFSQDSPATS